MGTIQIRLSAELTATFNEMNITPVSALRGFLRYVAENQRLPFSEVKAIIGELDDDAAILAIIRQRQQSDGEPTAATVRAI